MYDHTLFTYGTLESAELMRAVIGRLPRAVPGILNGFQRFQIKGQSFPAIIPARGKRTPGTLYFGLNRRDLTQLDRFEGQLYRRCQVRVRTARRWHHAEAYLLKERHYGRLTRESWCLGERAREQMQAWIEELLPRERR